MTFCFVVFLDKCGISQVNAPLYYLLKYIIKCIIYFRKIKVSYIGSPLLTITTEPRILSLSCCSCLVRHLRFCLAQLPQSQFFPLQSLVPQEVGEALESLAPTGIWIPATGQKALAARPSSALVSSLPTHYSQHLASSLFHHTWKASAGQAQQHLGPLLPLHS